MSDDRSEMVGWSGNPIDDAEFAVYEEGYDAVEEFEDEGEDEPLPPQGILHPDNKVPFTILLVTVIPAIFSIPAIHTDKVGILESPLMISLMMVLSIFGIFSARFLRLPGFKYAFTTVTILYIFVFIGYWISQSGPYVWLEIMVYAFFLFPFAVVALPFLNMIKSSSTTGSKAQTQIGLKGVGVEVTSIVKVFLGVIVGIVSPFFILFAGVYLFSLF